MFPAILHVIDTRFAYAKLITRSTQICYMNVLLHMQGRFLPYEIM